MHESSFYCLIICASMTAPHIYVTISPNLIGTKKQKFLFSANACFAKMHGYQERYSCSLKNFVLSPVSCSEGVQLMSEERRTKTSNRRNRERS